MIFISMMDEGKELMGEWQNNENIAWFTFYFRHVMVHCNKAAAVVTNSKAHCCPNSWTR